MLTGCDQSISDSVLIECSEVVHVALGWHLLGKHPEYGKAGQCFGGKLQVRSAPPCLPPPRISSLPAVIATLTTQAGALPEPYTQIKRSQKVRRARMETSADAKYS